MSTLTGSRGRSWSSVQLQRRGVATRPRTSRLQRSRGVRGVGPAERTGKSRVWYWPGGIRAGSTPSRRRPTKPRETNWGLIWIGLLAQRRDRLREVRVEREGGEDPLDRLARGQLVDLPGAREVGRHVEAGPHALPVELLAAGGLGRDQRQRRGRMRAAQHPFDHEPRHRTLLGQPRRRPALLVPAAADSLRAAGSAPD